MRVSGTEVHLDAAVPSPGFAVDVEHDGPARVEIEFRDGSHESRLHAEFHDGELEVETDESDDD